MLGKKTILLGVLLAALGSAQAGSQQTAEPVDGAVMRFHVSVRVDVDASGKPTLVEVPEEFPEGVRDFIGKRVASWQYLPASRDGVPQAATTYVTVDACAVPVEGGYRLDAEFGGNGPRFAGGRQLPTPKYPMAANRQGIEASIAVVLNVDGQGRASFERFEDESFQGGGRGRISAAIQKAFEIELRQWARRLRFDLERVAGQPAPMVQVKILVLYRQSGEEVAEWEAQQAEAKASNACRLAFSGPRPLEPVALTPPVVTVNPRPAGEG